MNSRFSELFDEPLVADSSPSTLVSQFDIKPWLIGLAVTAVLFALIVVVSSLVSSEPSTELKLFGTRTGQLQPGAAVVLAGIQVGTVDSVDIENGQPFATLSLKKEFARKIPGDSRFQVKPLSTFMPGNVGVVIEAGNESGNSLQNEYRVNDTDLGGRSLDKIKQVLADDSIIPTSTPTGMYVLLGVAALIASICFGVSWKVARSSFFRYAAIAVAVGAIIFLFYRGVISIGDVREWIEWAMNLIRNA